MAPLRLIIGVLALVAFVGAAKAVLVEELYQARSITTGQTEENRFTGFAECLTDVLVKVSGDPHLRDDPRVAGLARQAAGFIRAFRYRDRMEGFPIHDEQGTRDRPYDLTCDFDAAKIDGALQSLGSGPWSADRPRIAIFLAVRNARASYVLSDDGRRGPGQRESFHAAAYKHGIPIVLPQQAALAANDLTLDKVWDADPAALEAAARAVGGDRALVGQMEFSDEAQGWVAQWRFVNQGKAIRWEIRGVNFDEVFRTGMRGTAQILSGNGTPD